MEEPSWLAQNAGPSLSQPLACSLIMASPTIRSASCTFGRIPFELWVIIFHHLLPSDVLQPEVDNPYTVNVQTWPSSATPSSVIPSRFPDRLALRAAQNSLYRLALTCKRLHDPAIEVLYTVVLADSDSHARRLSRALSKRKDLAQRVRHFIIVKPGSVTFAELMRSMRRMSSLVILSLSLDDISATYSKFVISNALEAAEQTCAKSLRKLHFQFPPHFLFEDKDTTESLGALTELRTLIVAGNVNLTLKLPQRLDHLSYFSYPFDMPLQAIDVPLNTPPYPRLRHLHLSQAQLTDDVVHGNAFLNAQGPHCTSLTFDCTSGGLQLDDAELAALWARFPRVEQLNYAVSWDHRGTLRSLPARTARLVLVVVTTRTRGGGPERGSRTAANALLGTLTALAKTATALRVVHIARMDHADWLRGWAAELVRVKDNIALSAESGSLRVEDCEGQPVHVFSPKTSKRRKPKA
jgi:hypothetical protein